MATMYIFFKPTSALSYRIIWRELTAQQFPPANFVDVNKQPGLWNEVDITVSSNEIDWAYAVMPICNGRLGRAIYGIVRAICKKVTLEATWNNCINPGIESVNIEFS